MWVDFHALIIVSHEEAYQCALRSLQIEEKKSAIVQKKSLVDIIINVTMKAFT